MLYCDFDIVEFKCIWMLLGVCCQGIVWCVFQELEEQVVCQGYWCVFLIIGFCQFEVVGFYFSYGYIVLFDLDVDLEVVVYLFFEKYFG